MHPRASNRGDVRAAVLAVLALLAVLLSMATMHASMVNEPGAGAHVQASASSGMAMPAAAVSQVAAAAGSDHAMRDMNLADCLLLGMVCFLTAVAVLLGAVIIGRLRALLRPRAADRFLLATLGRLRPFDPPSLEALSISRT